jgi:hypothetical protein
VTSRAEILQSWHYQVPEPDVGTWHHYAALSVTLLPETSGVVERESSVEAMHGYPKQLLSATLQFDTVAVHLDLLE